MSSGPFKNITQITKISIAELRKIADKISIKHQNVKKSDLVQKIAKYYKIKPKTKTSAKKSSAKKSSAKKSSAKKTSTKKSQPDKSPFKNITQITKISIAELRKIADKIGIKHENVKKSDLVQKIAKYYKIKPKTKTSAKKSSSKKTSAKKSSSKKTSAKKSSAKKSKSYKPCKSHQRRDPNTKRCINKTTYDKKYGSSEEPTAEKPQKDFKTDSEFYSNLGIESFVYFVNEYNDIKSILKNRKLEELGLSELMDIFKIVNYTYPYESMNKTDSILYIRSLLEGKRCSESKKCDEGFCDINNDDGVCVSSKPDDEDIEEYTIDNATFIGTKETIENLKRKYESSETPSPPPSPISSPVKPPETPPFIPYPRRPEIPPSPVPSPIKAPETPPLQPSPIPSPIKAPETPPLQPSPIPSPIKAPETPPLQPSPIPSPIKAPETPPLQPSPIPSPIKAPETPPLQPSPIPSPIKAPETPPLQPSPVPSPIKAPETPPLQPSPVPSPVKAPETPPLQPSPVPSPMKPQTIFSQMPSFEKPKPPIQPCPDNVDILSLLEELQESPETRLSEMSKTQQEILKCLGLLA